jgi:hypothetical protein
MGRVAAVGLFLLITAAVPCHRPIEAEARLRTALPSLTVLHTLQPCFLQGDFDGDGEPDFALQVRDHATGKVGIAIENSSTRSWLVVGAGQRISSGEDNFDWMDGWHVARNALTYKGDAILSDRSEAAMGMIYWSGSEYRWFHRSQ